MYLHLGQSFVAPYRDIVGIFDLDTASWSHRTRLFLKQTEKKGGVVTITGDLPKSFVLCQSERKKGRGASKVYLSQLSSATLRGRVENNRIE